MGPCHKISCKLFPIKILPYSNAQATKFDFAKKNRSRATQGHHLFEFCEALVPHAACQVSRS